MSYRKPSTTEWDEVVELLRIAQRVLTPDRVIPVVLAVVLTRYLVRAFTVQTFTIQFAGLDRLEQLYLIQRMMILTAGHERISLDSIHGFLESRIPRSPIIPLDFNSNDKGTQTIDSVAELVARAPKKRARKRVRSKKAKKALVECRTSISKVIAARFKGLLTMAYRYHAGQGFAGSAYGHTWKAGETGCELPTMRAVHTLKEEEIDPTKHHFPDIQSDTVPQVVPDGAEVEVATPTGLKKFAVTGRMLTWAKAGKRWIWGVVPSFQSDLELVSGAPIFYERRLVSVVTRSDGQGTYAVSGIGRPSGHCTTRDFRVCKAQPGYAVYGNMVSTYANIKAEALRIKEPDSGVASGSALVMFPGGRLDYVEWTPNNHEITHLRMDARDAKVVAH